ncbi:hypothetical protein PO909_028112, partial [Leuciscus waleckii]
TSRTPAHAPPIARKYTVQSVSLVTVPLRLFSLIMLMLCRRWMMLLLIMICSLYSPESVVLVFMMVRDPV